MKNQIDYKRHGRAFLMGIAILTGVSIALLWGWNTFAVDMLSQQAMRFKHALALTLLLLSVAGVFPIAWRMFGTRPH